MIRLIPPKGTDEANANGCAYHVHDDGTMSVPEDEIGPLLHVGGFSLAPDIIAPAGPVAERRPVSIDDVMALARTHPEGDLKAQLLGALAAVAKSAPRRTIRLIAPKGCDGFAHAGERFDVDEHGFVDAPTEAVDSLTTVAGFAFAPDDPPPSPLADNETPADDFAPSPIDPVAIPPTAETDDAPPVASSIPRLVIPAIPSRSLAASDG
jgi:hypothetical protein